jgi:hypothetical protein
MPQIQLCIQRHTPSKGERGMSRCHAASLWLGFCQRTPGAGTEHRRLGEAILYQHGPGGGVLANRGLSRLNAGSLNELTSFTDRRSQLGQRKRGR